MAGSGRFDLTSSSPDSGFVNSRGNFFGPNLDRSGSFREGNESRSYGPGPTNSRASGMMIGNVPNLSQCLMLDPILIGDQKYTRLGELKRVLGSAGSSSEENSLSRSPPPVVFDELKRYKDGVVESTNKARFRAKKLDEHLHKLNKYSDVINSKKQARSGISSNERNSVINMKMGVQVHPNLAEFVPQRLEDRAKNTPINKRVRTSMAEIRAENRNSGVPRQPLATAKDRELPKDKSPSSDLVEEKVRRLPVGGEGWDKKMKRKRSTGPSLSRTVDGEGELKRTMHHKVIPESGLPPGDTQGVRSGSANGISGTNKLEGSSSPANSLSRVTPKHELGKANLVKDPPAGLNKGKPLTKGNNGLNIREDNHLPIPNPLPKLKASRGPRSNPGTTSNSSLNIPRVFENSDPSLSANKNIPVGITNIRKRTLSAGSTSPPMAQWVGQKTQKISRTRRANLVSPVPIHEETNSITYEGLNSPSDLSNKMNNSGGTSGSLMSKAGLQQFKVKSENNLSPAQFSGEESGACESGLKEKIVVSDNVDEKGVSSVLESGPSLVVTKKNKSITKEENGDGVKRQGRTARSSFSTATISPVRDKLDNNVVTTKPGRSSRPGGEKNGSKAGRPTTKKHVDRKGSSRRGPNTGSPDFTGESDDDREELLAAAVSACNANNQVCTSSFWKNNDSIFGAASLQDISYFSQQVKIAKELHGSLSQTLSCNNGDIGLENNSRSMEFGDQLQEYDNFCGKLDSERILNKVAPLCQRVLSALISEDEIDELEENYMDTNVSGQFTNDLASDSEPIEWEGMEYEYGSAFGARPGNRIFPCNGINRPNRSSNGLNPTQNGFLHSDDGLFLDHFGTDMGETEIVQRNGFTVSSFDSEYEKMGMEEKLILELQSIGIHLEPVPDLDDGEDEVLGQEIIQLKQGLHNQVGKKKTFVEKLFKSLEQGKEAEARRLETVAMNKLVESAHRKLLATRGSIASKYGIAKVSKQVALSFSKRTIARCKAFEESGTSCFNEPALKDALFAVSSQGNVVESAAHIGRVGSNLNITEQHTLHRGPIDAFENYAYQSDEAFAKNGPISNRGRKKEVLLASTHLSGAKGKRSDRERDGNGPKVGRPSLSNPRGERKSKSKPKQRTGQLSTPANNGYLNKFADPKHQKKDPGFSTSTPSHDNKGNNDEEEEEALDFSALPLPDLDTLDVLGGNDGLSGNQDLNSLLNFDDMGLLDHGHDSAGLEIPMDDLSELPMF